MQGVLLIKTHLDGWAHTYTHTIIGLYRSFYGDYIDFKKLKLNTGTTNNYVFKNLSFKIKYIEDNINNHRTREKMSGCTSESEIRSFLQNQIKSLLIKDNFNDIITFDIIVKQIEKKEIKQKYTIGGYGGDEDYYDIYFEILSEFTIKFSMNNLAPKILELQKLQMHIDAMKDCCTFD